jgi:hypothetical protein
MRVHGPGTPTRREIWVAAAAAVAVAVTVAVQRSSTPYNATRWTIADTTFYCKSMAQPIPQAWSHLVPLNVDCIAPIVGFEKQWQWRRQQVD